MSDRRATAPQTRERLGRWLVRGLLAALGAASCLCAGSAPPAASPSPTPVSPGAGAAAPAAAPVPVAPEALAGDWLFELTRGGEPVQFSLHFAVQGGVLAGSLTGPDGNARELSKIDLHDDKVSWDVAGDTATLHYEGTVSGAAMKGTVRRSGGRRSRGTGGESGEGSEGSSGSGGGFRGGGMRGRGRRSGSRGSGSGQGMTWSAYKTVASPPGEHTVPQASPTPSP